MNKVKHMGGGGRGRPGARAKTPPAKRLLTRRELAAKMGVSPARVDKWLAAGMPIAKRGAPGQGNVFIEADCRRWAAGRSSVDASMRAPIRLYIVVLLRAAEAQRDAILSRYIPDAEWRPAWSSDVADTKATMLAWVEETVEPLAEAMVLAVTPAHVDEVRRFHVRRLLTTLSLGGTEEDAASFDPERDLVPAPPPNPRPEPETVEDARLALIEARTSTAALRLAIRGPGWQRRTAVRYFILDAMTRVKFALWSGPLAVRLDKLAGLAPPDPAAVRAALTTTVHEALGYLAVPRALKEFA